jgi:cytidylate kinase
VTVIRVVAIDGAAGSGKSTLAKALARELRLVYVNTGLMYRALAAAALRAEVASDAEDALVELMRTLTFRVTNGTPPTLEVEGFADAELTGPEVERTVSAVARHPSIRSAMRAAQRSLGLARGAVMEGRDIGSMVFPDAPVKLYLVADAATRIERRADERGSADAVVAAALRARDEVDARTNPFVPPEGADVVDTGALSIEDTLQEGMRLVHLRAPWLLPEGEG